MRALARPPGFAAWWLLFRGLTGPVNNNFKIRKERSGMSEQEFQQKLGELLAQIAEALSLSPSTVGTHLYHVKQKLGASNQSELTTMLRVNLSD